MDEVRDMTRRRVIMVTTRLRPSQTPATIFPVGVGAIMWGRNGVQDIWLSGYSTQAGLLEAAMVQFIIEQRLGGEQLQVHAEELHAGLPPASSPEALALMRKVQAYLAEGRMTVLPNGVEKSGWAYLRARRTSEFAQSLASGWALEVLASGQQPLDPHVQELKVGLPQEDFESF